MAVRAQELQVANPKLPLVKGQPSLSARRVVRVPGWPHAVELQPCYPPAARTARAEAFAEEPTNAIAPAPISFRTCVRHDQDRNTVDRWTTIKNVKKLLANGQVLTLSQSFPRSDCKTPTFTESRFAVVEVAPFDTLGIFTLKSGDFQYLFAGNGSSLVADREVQALKKIPYPDWSSVTGGNLFNEAVRPRCYSKQPA